MKMSAEKVRGMDNTKGLYVKYEVRKKEDGSTVDNCFVLRPDKDKHAIVALNAYARSVKADNPALARDIRLWLASLLHREEYADAVKTWQEIENDLRNAGKLID